MSNTIMPVTVQLIRNATVVLKLGETQLLIDPLFSPKQALDPIPWTNEVRNPTVDLPLTAEALHTLVENTDYLLLTHLHPDHWDEAAQQQIPKQKPIICQDADAETLRSQGFHNLITSASTKLNNGITVTKVPAQHGHGEWAAKMAPVTGYILDTGNSKIYITGDTVWYDGVRDTLEHYQPELIILNAGGARFQVGEAITMTEEEVLQVVQHARPNAAVIAVHLEAINHCYVTRAALNSVLQAHQVSNCYVPADGEEMIFSLS